MNCGRSMPNMCTHFPGREEEGEFGGGAWFVDSFCRFRVYSLTNATHFRSFFAFSWERCVTSEIKNLSSSHFICMRVIRILSRGTAAATNRHILFIRLLVFFFIYFVWQLYKSFSILSFTCWIFFFSPSFLFFLHPFLFFFHGNFRYVIGALHPLCFVFFRCCCQSIIRIYLILQFFICLLSSLPVALIWKRVRILSEVKNRKTKCDDEIVCEPFAKEEKKK